MWICVGLSMVFVFSFWLFSLSHLLGGVTADKKEQNQAFSQVQANYQVAKKEIPGLWATLKAAIFQTETTDRADFGQNDAGQTSQSIFKETTAAPAQLPQN